MDYQRMVLLLLWSSGLQADGQQSSTGAQCEDKTDIVLLMDDSGSISNEDFQNMKLFFKELVRAFDIGPDKVQIGLVQYSDSPMLGWHLNTYQTKQSLLEAIDNLQQKGGGTNTGRALDFILRNNFKPNVGMRADSQKIGVLITDGQSQDDVLLPSQKLKDTGIEVYAIGVRNANETELRIIASDKIHIYNVEDSLELQTNNFTINLCYRALDVQCETTAKTDIVLLMDDSWSISNENFQNMKLFFQRLVSAFNIGPDRVRIGLVQYSDSPMLGWHLNTYQTKQSLLEAIDNLQHKGGGTNTGRALDFILRNNFKPNVGMRADSQKIGVLITDGQSQDDVLLPSQKLKDTGIEVYAIGVGDAEVSELMKISSNPDLIHSYDFEILQDVADQFAISLCKRSNNLDSVRLVNGTSLCSGRLEVKSNQSDQYNQSWSSVCEADFDQQDAEVVCRELGCGAPSVLWGGLFGEVEAPMWTEKFQCGGRESALLDCRRSGSARKTCSPGKAVGLTCSEPVRLVGGAGRCAGTLEVKRGEWRPVYGSHWTLTSAAAVCRQLDCGSAASVGMRNESSDQSAWEISASCAQSGYAIRECVSSGSSSSIMVITCSEPVRLVGGAGGCAGTLEVKRGEWRPVYGSHWTLTSAAAVCRQLDCGSAASVGMRNESLHKSIWEISASCAQSGSDLRECVSSGSSSSIMKITCSDSVRLVNGTSLCSGRLEVKSNQSDQYNQSWSSVCEADFDQQDAEVVCRELGCGAPSVLWGGLFGEVEAPMWTEQFQCGGRESALLDCRRSGSARKTCSPGKAVGLTCSEPVRLVGGAGRCAGTLEVKQGDWRPVGDSGWTLTSAAAVCRQLNCGSAASTRIRENSSKRSTWRISSDCVQSGSSLRECATLSWSSSILELTCSDLTAFIIRLVVVPLTLLLFNVVIYSTCKATRGQKPGP